MISQAVQSASPAKIEAKRIDPASRIFNEQNLHILTSRSLQLVCKYDMAAKVSGKFIKSEDPNLYRQKMEWMDSCDRHDRHGKHYARG